MEDIHLSRIVAARMSLYLHVWKVGCAMDCQGFQQSDRRSSGNAGSSRLPKFEKISAAWEASVNRVSATRLWN